MSALGTRTALLTIRSATRLVMWALQLVTRHQEAEQATAHFLTEARRNLLWAQFGLELSTQPQRTRP